MPVIQMLQQQPHVAKKVRLFKSVFMERAEWNIHSGKWARLEAGHTFATESQMHPRILELYGNKEPAIVKLIVQPLFTQLRHLNLKNNQIRTINLLSSLQAPAIEQLLLGDNFITSIREIVKLDCPCLKVLSLYANRVCQIDSLSQAHFPQLEVIILGLNCIAHFQALNKCHWPAVRKISFECNRKVSAGSRIVKWPEETGILYG